MDVTLYGVRGSFPIPGPTTLRYGGNTVHASVRLADGTTVLLDGGSGLRENGRRWGAVEGGRATAHFLLTHRHLDHLIGVPAFEPLYHPDFRFVVYPLKDAAGRWVHAAVLDGVLTPLDSSDLPGELELVEPSEEGWQIGSAWVRRIDLNHPGGAQGFRIDDGDGSSVTYLTDNELEPPGPVCSTQAELAAFARGTGLLIADAQYLPEDLPAKRGWGHSTVPQVLGLGREAGAFGQVLFHHDPDRSDDDLDGIAEQVREFAQAEMPAGPIWVGAEGMTFAVEPDSCRRSDEQSF